jgi:hypothetical protein
VMGNYTHRPLLGQSGQLDASVQPNDPANRSNQSYSDFIT